MKGTSDSRIRLLVVGSEGFIGRYVVNEFLSLRDRYEVHTVDIVAGQNASTVHRLINARSPDFNGVMQSHAYDLVINCSGAASVPASNQNPLLDYELNTANVARMLAAILETQDSDCRFLNLSSAAVYGNPRTLPISEDNVPAPISPYGLHKLQAEELIRGYRSLFSLCACSVRIFSAYGPGLRKQLFWDLYRKALGEQPIQLWGTGEESRDFIEVTDLARAIRIVSEKAEFTGEVINVASGSETTIRCAVELFLKHFNPSQAFEFNGQTKQGDPLCWRADVSRLRSMGFESMVSMDEGLGGYVDWIKGLTS